MYHFKRLRTLMLMLLVCMVAKAQLENGKVYNFVSVGKNQSMSIIKMSNVGVTATDTDDYSQLWYASAKGSGFTLRNLASGHYLKSPNKTSNAWTIVKEQDANCVFSSTKIGENYAIRVTGNSGSYNYMHADGSNNIVCWENSNQNSQWKMNVVEISNEVLDANWKALAEIDPSEATITSYKTHLDNLFNDKACTTLKKSFASEADVEADADYQALPTALQTMVMKVYKENWEESNSDSTKAAWDTEHAKKYRVQLYEPYNEPEAAATALGINAHTNLNNPTGIFADREPLYVMVEGKVKEGAALYLASYTGNGKADGGYANGVQLKEGLNVIPSFVTGNNYFINYVVHTFDTSNNKRGNKAKARKLSDYDDIKIHIEGGHINGYYNKVGDELYTPDKRADWDYIEARATQTTVTVLGEYITLQFPLYDAVDEGGSKNKGLSYYLDKASVEDVIDKWDDIMMWERLVLGLLDKETIEAESKKSPYSDKEHVFDYTGNDGDSFGTDYSDYYNIHGLSYGVGVNYMYGSWDHCGYHYNTMQSIMVDILTNAGSHWGPGHEIGHQHQGLLNMRGLTEVTNNLFANIVLWYFGETTSRYNGSNGALTNVLAAYNTEGGDFFTNNIWAQTIMYYKLFLYYHVLGHDTKFYPRLFEMLRQDPMIIQYSQSGAQSLLHFYKKCCLVSGDDLTEFFRAHGFFEVMNKRFVGDYSNAEYTMTQTEIDAAIAEVKALGYDENLAVLFINDATGGTIKSHKGDNLQIYGETTICAETGSYATYPKGMAKNASSYTYTLSGNNITMKGDGGVGYAIFDKEGEIMAFADKKTFAISTECATALATGEAIVKVINANNTMADATADEDALKYELLKSLITKVNSLKRLSDETGTKVGYYTASALTGLNEAYTIAKTVYDNKSTNDYSAAYELLHQAYEEVINNEIDRIGIIDGLNYRLENRKALGKWMAINTTSKALISNANNANDTKQQWCFEATGETDVYHIKNVNTSTYLGDLTKDQQISATADKAGAKGYKVISVGSGVWMVQCQNDSKQSLNLNTWNGNNKILGWNDDNDTGSHWYITAAAIDENTEALYKLQTLIEKTEALADEVGDIAVGSSTALKLTEKSYKSNAECKETTYGDQFKSYSVLCDNNTSTFFHSDYSSQAPNEDHYIRIDVGSDKKVQLFNLSYTTRQSGNLCAPTKMVIEACNDDKSWVVLRDITSGLPTTNNTSHTIEGLGNGTAYRYIRMTVYENSTGQKANGHYYFIVSELGLSEVTYKATLDERYASFITSEELLKTYNIASTAKGIVAINDTTELTSVYDTLKAEYDALLAKKKEADNAELAKKKEELGALIGNAEKLIEKYASCEENLTEIRKAIKSAESTKELATTTDQVENAIKRLLAKCEELEVAMNYQLNVSNYEYAGLYLPYAATIPTGATVYIATNATTSAVELQALEGNVIPAYTAVIVKAEEGIYTFGYTENEATDIVTGNLLKGSTSVIYKEADAGYSYYILGVKNDETALYKASMNYSDKNGSETAVEGQGTFFKVSANNIYFDWENAEGASMLRLTHDGMGIENPVTGTQGSVIYDLTGRRIEHPAKGIYIINGKKVVID